MRYLSKPREVEAMLYEGGVLSWHAVHEFVGKDLFPYMINPSSKSVHIETGHGRAEVKVGDWIIKDSRGKFYPCDAAVFEASYAPVDAWTVDETAQLRADLEEATGYLRQGKAQFMPGTTNSLVDTFLSRMDARTPIRSTRS